jgi:hypothetical protein
MTNRRANALGGFCIDAITEVDFLAGAMRWREWFAENPQVVDVNSSADAADDLS